MHECRVHHEFLDTAAELQTVSLAQLVQRNEILVAYDLVCVVSEREEELSLPRIRVYKLYVDQSGRELERDERTERINRQVAIGVSLLRGATALDEPDRDVLGRFAEVQLQVERPATRPERTTHQCDALLFLGKFGSDLFVQQVDFPLESGVLITQLPARVTLRNRVGCRSFRREFAQVLLLR